MSCIIPRLKTRDSAKQILKEARNRQGWAVDSREPLRKASKLLDPNWEDRGDAFHPGITNASWKFFLYGMRKIDTEIFQAYCEVLELNWQEIAEIP
ncbi:MAG: hypothetical protein MUE44_30990 [Oscillatoriaceae cyanobacterium Prado104]|jgi:hypothetical protein|nr:hypothetical protein [Oscillatoriaceae cyanobacterium Prado104]